MKRNPGFTLIELMIVVAIIGILAVVAIPKFADLIRKSEEGATKGNLGTLRSTISIYYSEAEGWFPIPTASGDSTVPGSLGSILTMQNGKYIEEIPKVYCPPYHQKDTAITIDVSTADESSMPGLWGYKSQNDGLERPWGDIWVNCTHTDTKGVLWGMY
jgi:prepilin-type N-terminal cleavage/methylation domain-containing protein